MTEPTEDEIRAAHAEDARDGGHMESSAESRRKRWAAHEHRAVLLRLLDEARADIQLIAAPHESVGHIVLALRAERDGARALAEQYQRQIRALEEAVRQASTGCRERNHAGLDRLIGGPIENHAIVGPDKLSDGPQPWMGQDVAFLAMAVQEEIAALRAEAEANRRDAERWRYLKEVCSVTTRGRFAGMQDAEMQDAIDAAMQKEPLHD